MAIDASHLPLGGQIVHFVGLCALHAQFHEIDTVTVSTFATVGIFHAFPHMAGQLWATGFKFFGRRYRTLQPMKQLICGSDFSRNLMYPFLWHMTVRAGGPYTGAVFIMDGLAIFLIDIVPHDMTRNTEILGIGQLERPVKAAPNDNPHQHCAAKSQQRIDLDKIDADFPPTRKILFKFTLFFGH